MAFIKRSNLKRKSHPYLKLIIQKDNKSSEARRIEFVDSLIHAPRFTMNYFDPAREIYRLTELTGIKFRPEYHMVGTDGKIYDNVYTEEKNSEEKI